MPSEVEYVNFKDFVEGLSETENPTATDKAIVSNGTDGPRTVPANAGALSDEATESDMSEGNAFTLDTPDKMKKLDASLVAKASEQTALAAYAQNVSASIAPEFVPNETNAVAGQPYMYNGSRYVAKEAYQGPWDSSKFEQVDLSQEFAELKKTVSDISETTKNIIPVTVVQETSTHGLTYSVGEKNFVYIGGTTDSANVDVNLALRESKTLSAGNYCISLQGKFVRGGASVTAYLRDGSSNTICYGTFNDAGYALLSVASESELRSIRFRFSGSGSTPDMEGGLQLESGIYPTAFEDVLSAVDYKSRNKIEELYDSLSEKTNNIVSLNFAPQSSTHGLTYSVGEKNFVYIGGTTDSATVDIDLALRESKTLSAGNYCISLQGKFVRGGASVTAYLRDGSSNTICYGAFNDNGYALLSVASESELLSIKFRFSGSGSTPDMEGGLQLESGIYPTAFEGALSAVDYKSRNAIDLLERTVNNKFDSLSEKTNNIVSLNFAPQSSTHGLTYSVGDKNFVYISGTTDSATVDVDLALHESKTLPAGNYCISLQGKFVRGGASVTAYLRDGPSDTICYGSFNDNGYALLSVASESELRSIRFRFSGSGSTPDMEGGLQLESGIYPTAFEGALSAVDYKSRNAIDLLERTANNKVDPIFDNGTMNNSGIPTYSDTNTCKSWLVTPKIYKIKKGSCINYVGNKNIYINVAKFVNGQFSSSFHIYDFNEKILFHEDTEVRISMRFMDSSAIVPEDARSNLQFEFYSNDEQKSDLKLYFLGLGSGLSVLSGYSVLAKLPNGKNLVVDSHQEPYYSDVSHHLRDAGIRKIDYYVQTHYHGDHTGILTLIRNYADRIDMKDSVAFLPPTITTENISQVTHTGDDPQALVDRQTALEAYLTTNDCTIIRPDSATDYDLGGGVKLRFYNTNHSIYSDQDSGYYSTNYNDWSICPQILFGMNVVNLSSDIGPIGQRKVGGTLLKANILTAPHHGWDNGVNNLVPAFINNVSPDVVISLNGSRHHPDNSDSSACVMKSTSAMQSYCEANAVPNYLTCLNGQIKVIMNENAWKFDGTYSRYIRNDKNWSYTDNSEHIES